MNDFKNAVGFIPYLFSTLVCIRVLFSPRNQKYFTLNIGLWFLTALVYLISFWFAWNGSKYSKFDFLIGIMFFIAAVLQTVFVVLIYLKPDKYSYEKRKKSYHSNWQRRN